MSLAPPDDPPVKAGPGAPGGAPDGSAVFVRSAATALAAELARQEVRVSVALDLTVRAEARAEELAAAVSDAARRLAELRGAPVPRLHADEVVADERHPAVLEGRFLVEVRAAELRRRARRGRTTTARAERWAVGLVAFVGFASLGFLAAVRAGWLPGDAVSRVQLALAVVAGRDPHPEAIGFVWGPFPTVFEVPLTLLRGWWPELTASALAAVVVSAALMATMLAQLVGWARDCGTPRWARLSIVVLTALTPLIWIGGANGMSEAAWLCFLVLACRHLARWADGDDVSSLVVAGVALGVCYLTRYESAAAIAAAVGVVALIAWRRSEATVALEGGVGGSAGPTRRRLRATVLDVAVVAFPAAAAVLGWTLASWVIIGEPFSQFTSDYGNAALVKAAGSLGGIVGDTTVVGRVWFFVQQCFLAAPVVVPLLLLVVWIGDRAARRAGIAVAVIGAPLALQLLLAARGQTFPWFRYVVGAVVLTALLALTAAGSWAWVQQRRWIRPLAVLALVPGILLTLPILRSGNLGAEDEELFVAGVTAALDGRAVPERTSLLRRGERVARDLDGVRGVQPGAVLTDTSSTFAIVAAAPEPADYVIPSDRDFEAVVADPGAFGIRYVLIRTPATPGDAVVAQHPRLVDGSDPAFELVRTWGRPGDVSGTYSLYRVLDVTGAPRPHPDRGFVP